MTAWVLAAALEQLRDQVNVLAPGRSKRSDGTIGDAVHATRKSDHNPWWKFAGLSYVTALDLTHDPGGGLDCAQLAATLVHSRDQRIKYLIWDGGIVSGQRSSRPWVWRKYTGPNPHRTHLHVSVAAEPQSLHKLPWNLSGLLAPPPVLREGSKGPHVASLQRFLNAHDWTPDLPLVTVDGAFGGRTRTVVELAQKQCGLAADGVVGPHTRTAFEVRGWRP